MNAVSSSIISCFFQVVTHPISLPLNALPFGIAGSVLCRDGEGEREMRKIEMTNTLLCLSHAVKIVNWGYLHALSGLSVVRDDTRISTVSFYMILEILRFELL
jgi:hypothetical protein